MEDNINHSSFSFIPRKLREEREKLHNKYGDGEAYFPEEMKERFLSKLLNKIKKISFEDEIFKKFSLSLNKMEIRLLLYDFPFLNETESLNQKILKIFHFAYTSEIGINFWSRLQNNYANKDVLEFLCSVFKIEKENFLNLDTQSRKELNHLLDDNFFNNLVLFFAQSNQSLMDNLIRFKLDEKRPLGREIIKQTILKTIVTDNVINKNGIPFILRYMSSYFEDDYKIFCKSYISNRKFDKFHYDIIKHMLTRLSDPRYKKEPWDFLDEYSIQQLINFLNLNDMKTFFEQDGDNERFNYWKKYFEIMKDFDLIKKGNILCMDFDQFVVVEFGNIGAAYFYHKRGFDKIIKPSKKQQLSNAALISAYKNRIERLQGVPLFINRLTHYRNDMRSYWHEPFDAYMNEYLRGNFNFKHQNYRG